jgi:diphthamide biosynthesis protein 2
MSAPALSTPQDADSFGYARITSTTPARPHLGPAAQTADAAQLACMISRYYSLDKLAHFLLQEVGGARKHQRVTLQFPDLLICDSATVVHELQRRLGLEPSPAVAAGAAAAAAAPQQIWILADTSYSACCVDEVAAEHVHSDLVVHFGDACLNRVDRLGVAYVFGRPHFDCALAAAAFRATHSDRAAAVMLMSDATHAAHLQLLYEALRGEYPRLGVAGVQADGDVTIIDGGGGAAATNLAEIGTCLNRRFYGPLPALRHYHLFHVTVPQPPRLLQLTTRFASVACYDPAAQRVSTAHPSLARRYRCVHMARLAGTVGLLINTLSLAHSKQLVARLARAIRAAGKKHYVFVVGKPNVAKLANFEAVDLWCVLGCDHQGIILDEANEYFKPIVTPYELTLALEEEVEWTGEWVTDFRAVMARGGAEGAGGVDGAGGADGADGANGADSADVESGANHGSRDGAAAPDDDAPQFDPVTGRYVTSRPLRRAHIQVTSGPEESATLLVKRFATTVAIKNTVSTSAAHLQSRSWTGLGSDYDSESAGEGAALEDGRGGIARGYDYDRQNR